MSWGNIILKAVMMTVVVMIVTADAWGRDPRIDWSLAIAERWWGPHPCGTPDVVLDIDHPDPLVLGWAMPGCTIWLDRSKLNGGRIATWKLCGTIVHEWGHTIGKTHSDDKWDVMYPVIIAVPTPCHRWHYDERKRLRREARARAIKKWRHTNGS